MRTANNNTFQSNITTLCKKTIRYLCNRALYAQTTTNQPKKQQQNTKSIPINTKSIPNQHQNQQQINNKINTKSIPNQYHINTKSTPNQYHINTNNTANAFRCCFLLVRSNDTFVRQHFIGKAFAQFIAQFIHQTHV